jgi:hypothetical protein
MEQQVWSVQHARQSTLRPRVAAPAEAGGFGRPTPLLQQQLHAARLAQRLTLRCIGPVRASELRSGDTFSSASKPEQVRVVSLLCGTFFTSSPTLLNALNVLERAGTCDTSSD